MDKSFKIGKFDLDIALRDAALDELNRPTRRMLANASIGMDAMDAYYAAQELFEAVKGVFDEGGPKAKAKLVQVLSCQCDDFQRCLYYAVAGRGITLVLDDLEWLVDLLAPRCKISADLFRKDKWPIPLVNPYISTEPDGPIPSRNADFEEGSSWYLDPGLGGGMIE